MVDGAVGGTVPPEEMAEELHETFGDLGLPYYVVVTPFLGAGSEVGLQEIVPAVHDRLGSDGLYVVMEPEGRPLEVEAYGVEADATAAMDAANADPELDYDSPATDVAEVMAAALADPAVAEDLLAEQQRFWLFRADTLADFHPSRRDGPENFGFLVGAVGGATVVAGGWWVWRLVRRGRGRTAAVVGVGAVVVAAGAVSGPAGWVAGAPVGEHEVIGAEERARMEEPYVVSTGRVEHVAERLAEEPVYVDPLVQLPREGLDGVAETMPDAPVPVYAAVVPLGNGDESGGDHEVLAAALAAVAEREGVYLVVGRGTGEVASVGAATYGLGADYSFSSSLQRIEGDSPADALNQAVAALDEVELTPGGEYTPRFAEYEPSPPPPRMERYWVEGVAPGFLMFGLLVGPAVIGLVWLAVYALRVWRGGGRIVGDRVLRRLATRETGRLRALLARREGDLPEELLPQADAALLVMDADPGTLDLLGVVVLARRVLAEAENPTATGQGPCAVNPLHPWATERGSGAGRSGQANLCADCAARGSDARAARTLRLRSGSTAHPYDSKPSNPWIRNRFGAENPRRMVEALLKEHHVS